MAQHQNRPISNVPICCLFPASFGSQELSWKLWPLRTAAIGQFLQCHMLSKEILTGAGEWKYYQHLSYRGKAFSLKRSPQTSQGPFKTAGWSWWQKESFYPCTSVLGQKLPCVVEGTNVLNILFTRLKSYSNLTLMKNGQGD